MAERSSGIRFLLMITKDGIYLIDANFDFHFVPNFDPLFEIYNDALLDGEMVHHKSEDKLKYIVSDVIMINGLSCLEYDFSKRLEIIERKIIAPFRDLIAKKSDNLPFSIVRKNFEQLKDIQQIFNRIKIGDKGERYLMDDKRHHKTIGLIFSPDRPYCPYVNCKMYAWKYLDSISIFLKIEYQENIMIFTCQGPEDLPVEYKISFRRGDQDKLERDYSSSKKHKIIECTYDHWNGVWHYKQIRKDKTKANSIEEIFEILETISQNISQEELVYRLSASRSVNWNEKMNECYQSVLATQINTVDKH